MLKSQVQSGSGAIICTPLNVMLTELDGVLLASPDGHCTHTWIRMSSGDDGCPPGWMKINIDIDAKGSPSARVIFIQGTLEQIEDTVFRCFQGWNVVYYGLPRADEVKDGYIPVIDDNL